VGFEQSVQKPAPVGDKLRERLPQVPEKKSPTEFGTDTPLVSFAQLHGKHIINLSGHSLPKTLMRSFL
jgi:hypothetical protein